MRTLLLTAALLGAAASARADAALQPPVQVEVTGFAAKLVDGRVLLSWRRYKREDFISYAVVKSDKDADPKYPGSTTVVTYATPDGRTFVDGKLAAGTWSYRLVITTRFGERWVSPVVPVAIGPGDLHRSPPGASDFAD